MLQYNMTVPVTGHSNNRPMLATTNVDRNSIGMVSSLPQQAAKHRQQLLLLSN